MYLSAPRRWGYPTTLAAVARNFVQDQNAYQRRMGNSVSALRELGARVNHLGAFSPRVSFAQSVREADIEPYGSNILFATQSYVVPPNGQNFVVRALTLPRIYDTTDNAIMRVVMGLVAGGYQEDSSQANAGSTAPRWPEDLLFSQARMTRLEGDAPRPMFIQTFGGYTIVDMCVQDESVPTLDTGVHAAVRVGLGSGGREALWDLPEEIRYAFERLRTGNLPVMFQWHARGTPAGWATSADLPAGGDHRGMLVTSGTFVNLFDQTVTERSATSPGFYCPACYTGIGHESKAAGQSIGVKISVFATVEGVYNPEVTSTVRLVGPTHVVENNYVDISIPAGSSPDWYTSASLLSLNTMSSDDDTTTARNKVDPLAKVGVGGDKMIVYAVKGEMYIP